MHNTTRNEVKQLAQTLESLAHEIQVRLEVGDGILDIANELARNSSTFVFTLGSMYALDELGNITISTKKKSRLTTPSISVHPNFHNVRDSRGRFARKV